MRMSTLPIAPAYADVRVPQGSGLPFHGLRFRSLPTTGSVLDAAAGLPPRGAPV